jgi:hypothetical protein
MADTLTLIGMIPLPQRKVASNDQKFSKLNGIFGGANKGGDMRTQKTLYGAEKPGV